MAQSEQNPAGAANAVPPESVYSARVLEEARNPHNMGGMLNPDGGAIVHGRCGDTMGIYLRLDGQTIRLAAFMTDGCEATIACGSALTVLARGQTIQDALAIGPAMVIAALGGLPEESEHCAALAVTTLREAILNYLDGNTHPLEQTL